MSRVLRWCRRVPVALPLLLFTVLLSLGTTGAQAQVAGGGTGGMHPLCVSGCLPAYAVSAWANGSATEPPNSGPYTASFGAENQGTNADSYSLSCSHTGAVTSCSVSSTNPLALASGATNNKIRVSYSVGNPGLGTVVLHVVGEASDDATFSVNVVAPPANPTVSLAPYDDAVRSYSACVAACGALLLSHTTPAYVTRGEAHALTLVYNSQTAYPTPVVQADVTPPSGVATPTSYKVELRRVSDNALLTLLNGGTAAYFAGSSQTTRVAAAFDARANGWSSGVYPVKLTVTANFPGGSPAPTATTLTTQVTVVDRSQSVFGAGVWPADLPQALATNGGVLLMEGDGSTVFYRNNGAITPGGTSSQWTPGRLTALDGSYLAFNSAGQPIQAVNRFGLTTATLTWSGSQLTAVTDAVGYRFVLGYSGGKLHTVSDTADRVTTLTIDSSGRLTQITDPDTVASTLSYGDATHPLLVTATTARGGAVTNYSYDALVRLNQTQAPQITSYTGATARPTTTQVSWESRAWQPGVAGTSANSPKAAQVSDSVLAVLTDPAGAVTTARVDRFGAPLRIVNPSGLATIVVRDTMSRPTGMTLPRGHSLSWLYGSTDNPATNYSPYLIRYQTDNTTGVTLAYTYDSRNQPVSVTGGATDVFYSYFNGSGGPAGALHQVWLHDTLGTPVEVHYPNAWRADTLVTDGNPAHYTKTWYDSSSGMVDSTEDALGNRTRLRYTLAGAVDTTYAADGGVSAMSYGLLGQLLTTRMPDSALVQTVYNPDFTIARVVDGKGQVYKFEYNALGGAVAQHDLADTTRADSTFYDAAGRAVQFKTRRGYRISLQLDSLGRVLSRAYRSPGSSTDTVTDTYRYERTGAWMVATNAVQTDSIVYNTVGRITEWFQQQGTKTYRWTYTYDGQGRLTNRALYLNGTLQSFGGLERIYDSTGMVRFNRVAGVEIETQRDPRDLTTIRRNFRPLSASQAQWYEELTPTGDHSLAAHSFHSSGAPTANTALLSGTWRVSGQYSYDSTGHLTGQGLYTPNGDAKYRYDHNGRLVQACIGDPCINEYGVVGADSTAYTYDRAGNRSDPHGGAAINPGNRYWSFQGYGIQYDADGNMVAKIGHDRSWSFVWDAYDRLVQVRESDTLVVAMSYDALGRRVARSGAIPDGAEQLVYDGDQLIFSVSSNGALEDEFGWAPGVGRLAAMKTWGWTGVALTDPAIQTSVMGVADAASAQLYKQYDMGPWGQAVSDTGARIRIRMAGAQYDQETGLYYMRARYYDPELGRFLSEDPAGIAGGLNLYAYAGNDPINAWDPSGMDPCAEPARVDADGTIHVQGICVTSSKPQSPGQPPRDLCLEDVRLCASIGLGGCLIEAAPGVCSDPGYFSDDDDTDPPEPAPEHGVANPACRIALVNATVTIATDALFFTGVGTGVAAEIRAGEFAARTAAVMGEYGARGISVARLWNRAERQALATASHAYGTAADGVVTGAFKTAGWGVFVQDLNWRDFIPGLASVRAYRAARAACR